MFQARLQVLEEESVLEPRREDSYFVLFSDLVSDYSDRDQFHEVDLREVVFLFSSHNKKSTPDRVSRPGVAGMILLDFFLRGSSTVKWQFYKNISEYRKE